MGFGRIWFSPSFSYYSRLHFPIPNSNSIWISIFLFFIQWMTRVEFLQLRRLSVVRIRLTRTEYWAASYIKYVHIFRYIMVLFLNGRADDAQGSTTLSHQPSSSYRSRESVDDDSTWASSWSHSLAYLLVYWRGVAAAVVFAKPISMP